MVDSTADEGGTHVEVRGRLSIDPVDRELPSGTPIVSFRLVIPAVTALTIGVQTMFSSFFLSILGLRRR